MGRIGDNDEEGDMDRVIWMETVVAGQWRSGRRDEGKLGTETEKG